MKYIDWKWLLFSPKGRINRKLFIIGLFINLILSGGISSFGAYILSLYVDIKDFSVINLTLVMLIQIPSMYLIFAITSKRLHDINISTKWIVGLYLLYFVPQLLSHSINQGLAMGLILISYLIAIVFFLVVLFKKGIDSNNKYGDKRVLLDKLINYYKNDLGYKIEDKPLKTFLTKQWQEDISIENLEILIKKIDKELKHKKEYDEAKVKKKK